MTQHNHISTRAIKLATSALLSSAAIIALATPAHAQLEQGPAPSAADVDDQTAEQQDGDTIVVEGIRETQRNSLEIKRNANVIVDALVSEEIGATPDQSVGETLERIVGVTSDRFKGSASEISIRGLGPFLGFSTLNGREVTSGSGDRAVSFQQFPSELVNGVLVYKSQNAELIEGGTSGIVELRTIRPLDYGKRRITLDARAVYEPYDDKIDKRDGLGSRLSVSYVDQFGLGDGELGISIGYARADEAAPEDFYTESSSVRPCNSVGGNNCSYNPSRTTPTYFVPNSFLWRQMNNDLTRDAVMGTIQYMPRPELDINIDGQFSRRKWVENRSDIVLAEGRRGITPTADGVLNDGTLLTWSGNSRFESQTRIRERDEDYYGGGLSVEWTDDAARVGFDVSYSETQRDQVDRQTRLRTGSQKVGTSGALVSSGFSNGRIPYTFNKSSGAPVLTLDPRFDITDHANFYDAGYARRRAEYRNDKIFAVRIDGEAFVADGFLRSIQGGLRYSDHKRNADLDNANDIDPISTALQLQANANCRIDFRERDFFGDNGTNISNWAQFDPLCAYRTFTGSDDLGPAADPRSEGDINVREQIMAGYAMANFATPNDRLGGNIGVRVVNTQVTATGFRGSFNVVNQGGGMISLQPTGDFREISRKNNFWTVLPSLNVKFAATDDFLVRAAVYKSISRPNIEDLGAGRSVDAEGGTFLSIQDAIAGISGGNPRLEPLKSWNGDVSLEWYPSDANAVTLAGFYKKLQVGIVPASGAAIIEPFIIDGNEVLFPVAQQTNSDEKSELWGFEATLNHSFTYLPGLLSGFGVIAGYSYADTNFEYPDPSIVDGVNPLANFVDPASFIGLSKHTLSAEGYYEKGPIALRAVYKYRSPYFKPFQLAANRYSQDQESFDVSASLSVTENIQLRFQAINLFNNEYILSRPTLNSVSEISHSGTKYYAGVKLRF